MLKQCLVNFFKSFKHFFTPLGTMFLGLLAGFSVLIPGTLAATNALVDNVKEIAAGVNLDFGTLWEQLRLAITALDWDDPFASIKTMFSAEWIDKTLTDSLTLVLGADFATFAEKVQTIIGTFTDQILACVFVFSFLFVIGFIVGFILLKFFIRRNMAKRSLWKWLLSSLLNAVLPLGLAVVIVILFGLWKPSALFTVLLSVIIMSVYSLTQAYLVYGYKKVKFSEVLNVKNAGLYLAGNLLILLISFVISILAILLNVFAGIFVGLAILGIALCVMSMNAESYVQGLV